MVNIIVSTLNAKYIHTSLALRYLKSMAEPEYTVHMREYTINDPTLNIVSDLYAQKPSIIGFSCYIWNIEETIAVIRSLKKVLPDVCIVLGGPEVSYDIPYWLERIPEANFIIYGEGEKTFKDVLDKLHDENGNVEDVLGIAYRKNGKTKVNPVQPKLDLRTIPTPFRFEEDLPHLSKRIVYFETSRGCPFRCQFCLSSIESGVRYFDIEQVKSDLLFLIQNGAKTIKFVDRTFNIKKEYAMEMFQFLIDNHNGCVFQFEITADIMRPEVIEFLNERAPAGIFRFEIGVQSTNDETNLLVQRRQNFDKLANIVRMVKDGGKITQHLDLIAGLPNENYTSFRTTFNDVFELRPEELQLGFLKLLRGTGLRLQEKDFGYVYTDEAPYEMLANNVLDFNDVIRIKRVEDMLEKYWNDHRFDHTVRYLVEHEFDSAFDFFQQFGDFWVDNGWSGIGHQLYDLFQRLYAFAQHANVRRLGMVHDLLVYDFLLQHKHKPRRMWMHSPSMSKQMQNDYRSILSQRWNTLFPTGDQALANEPTLRKHTAIELLQYDVPQYVRNDYLQKKPTLLIVHYTSDNSPKTYSVPLGQLQAKSFGITSLLEK